MTSIECFVAAAHAGSFSAAARQLGLTSAAVGKNVARLESSLGVRLFHRSTRKLSLTEAGERFLQEVSGGLQAILLGYIQRPALGMQLDLQGLGIAGIGLRRQQQCQ